ncbi:hypothetical protein K7432_000266 [Basidiobolus ranarum]|uniref:EF-hand domain-containing protein n=1 Tax=Basidiobolus ranarum TaxID=34480 RepID=A0ABR2WBE2_9FUNG
MLLFHDAAGLQSPNKKKNQVEQKTPNSLQANLKAIFTRFDYDNKGTIVAEDLFPILDLFEREQGISLLDAEPKGLLNKFCQKNSDLELSAEDLHRLISQLSSPLNIRTPSKSPRISTPRSHSALGFVHPLSPLSSRKRTTPIISKTISTKKVAVSSLRRRSLSQSGFPSRLFFDKEERKLSPHFSNTSHSIIEEDNPGSVIYSRSLFLSDSADSLDSPRQLDMIDKIKTPKSARHYRDTIESWRERSYEASSWISSASEGDVSYEGLEGEKARLEFERDEDLSSLQISHLNRITVDLNKRLRQAEKSLNFSVHQHEDRISDLQHRIDDMHNELVIKKRDIQELKGHEKTHLAQINMLESEVVSVSRLLTHHKNMYSDLKRQCEEKKAENENFQQQLRYKEKELCEAEAELLTFASEQKKFQEERTTLEKHIARLENEVRFAQTLETEVNELQEENHYLRNVVENLRNDLDDAIKGIHNSSGRESEMHSYQRGENLHSELAPLLQKNSDQSKHTQIVPDSDQRENLDLNSTIKYANALVDENNFFKSQVDDATQKWMDALEQLQQAKSSVKEEREALLAEIEHLRNPIQVPVSHQDMITQCDLLSVTDSLVDASVQYEYPENLEEAIDTTPNAIAPCTTKLVVNLEEHQLLENSYQKLTKEFDSQKTIINELLTLNDSQAHTVSAASKYDTNTVGHTLGGHSQTLLKLIMYTLMIFVLGILSSIILSNLSFYTESTNALEDSYMDTSSWMTQVSNEIYHSNTSAFKFITQWFNIFSDDNDMVQIPT